MNKGTLYGLTAFALTGVRCQRLEHGYMPHNHFQNELEPIYEDSVTGPVRKLAPRRSPSPINVLTNGSFYSSNEDVGNKMAHRTYSTGLKHSKMTRSSSDVSLSRSRMLSEMMSRRYRRRSEPCLTSLNSLTIDVEHDRLDMQSRNSSLESLVMDVSSITESGSHVPSTEMTSSNGRSSIYQGHIGSTMLSKYILDTVAKGENPENMKRPKVMSNQNMHTFMCFSEKKLRKRLFLLCFGVFVTMVIFFLASIWTGWYYEEHQPDSAISNVSTPHTIIPFPDRENI